MLEYNLNRFNYLLNNKTLKQIQRDYEERLGFNYLLNNKTLKLFLSLALTLSVLTTY